MYHIFFIERLSDWGELSLLAKLLAIFADIKIQHTVFALPFAVMSAFIAAEGLPETEKLVWIVVCMVGARSAAMAFNRIVDARFDKENPRTQGRALPSGLVDVKSYWIFLIASSGIFIFAAGKLNLLALYLSPLALIIVFLFTDETLHGIFAFLVGAGYFDCTSGGLGGDS